MRSIIFVALNDARFQLKQRSTLVWVFVMPPVFFYFIGTMTGGLAVGVSRSLATPITVVAESPGFLREQIDRRLRDNNFDPVWVEEFVVAEGELPPRSTLIIGASLTASIAEGLTVPMSFDSSASALNRDFEAIRVKTSLYTALADILVAKANSVETLSSADLVAVNEEPRFWQLEVSPAGNRAKIPQGFEQSIPGILVMFTLLIVLTSGGTMLVIEREQGLLRRLASTPISRAEVVAGKLGGRMILAIIQVVAALLVGTFMFDMQWGPNLAMVLLVLTAWAGFCACAGLLLGSLASSEAQVSGLGVLFANALAALGGCWWPIEITPEWVQGIQKLTPTGWTMEALHKLISFQSEATAVLPQLAILLTATGVIAALAVKHFRYQ